MVNMLESASAPTREERLLKVPFLEQLAWEQMRQGNQQQEESQPEEKPAGRHKRPLAATASLLRNSFFLALNLGLGAGCGFGSLSLVTRLYPVHDVGLSAAALSATSLVTAISMLGMNYSLPRFLPAAGQARTVLLNTVLTVTILVAMTGARLFLLLPSAASLAALGGAAFAVSFVLFNGFTAGFNQLENILVADRAAHKIVGANVVTSLVKLGAPLALLPLGVAGVYWAQNVPLAVGFVVLAVVLARSGHRFRPRLDVGVTRPLRRYSIGSYIAGLIGGLPAMVVPLIILARFGATQNAYWYTAMAVATVLYQLPGNVGQALLAEAAREPASRLKLMKRATVMITAVMGPVLAVAYVAAPLGLRLLGHAYAAEATGPLRWLIVAGAMSSVNYLTGTVLYLAKDTFIITGINVVGAIVVLGLAFTWATSADGVAMAWVAGEVTNVILFPAFAIRALIGVGWKWELLGESKHA